MKTLANYIKNSISIKSIILLLFVVGLTSCGKDDDPVPKEIAKSSEKQITSFVFLLTNNPIEVNVVATINEENKTITATMPPDTDITGLLPEVKLSELATVDFTTAQDFTEPLDYKVTAEDGSTTVYKVTITTLLTQRQILQAILDANPGNTLDWDLQNTADLGDLVGVTTNVDGHIIELNMREKELTQLPKEIGQLTSLTVLSLIGNQLTSLPPEIGQLTDLIELRLAANNISTIPEEIWQLKNLEHLSLSNNQLSELPPEIGQLTNLEYLGLSENQLNDLPAEIGQLTNLLSLSFNDNQLSSIPSEIGQLSKLKYLYLRANQLSTLPQEIRQLSHLEYLNLARNQLASIPSEIGQLSHLETLFLEGNQLTSLPSEIGFLTKLEYLNIYNNDFDLIPRAVCYLEEFHDTEIIHSSNAFCGTPSGGESNTLVSIYSSNPGNKLGWGVGNYPGVTFDANGNLTRLELGKKGLVRLPAEVGGFDTLEYLDVNDNDLESLPVTLGDINTLAFIFAAGNKLETVPKELGQLTNLGLLSLTQNPLNSIPQEVCDLQKSNGGKLTLLTDPGKGCD